MLVLFLLACCGVLWLVHRCSLLLSLPLELSVKALNIPIPKIPLISIDKVSNDSICIHWSTETENDSDSDRKKSKFLKPSIAYYQLYVNGLEACKLNGSKNKCILKDLKPNSNYQIDLVAFNQTGFRSKSSPVFVKTCAKEFDPEIKNLDEVVALLMNKHDHQTMTKNYNTPRITNEKPELTQLATELSTNNGNKLSSLTSANPHLMEDPNDLKYLLESVLFVINENMKSYKAAELDYQEEKASLLTTKQAAQERKNFEDANRSNLRSEIKFLEDQKVKSKTGVDSLNKKINEMSKKIDTFNAKIKEWSLEMERMRKTEKLLIDEEPKLIQKLKDDINTLNKEIFSQQSEIHEAEDDLRNEISKRKSLESQKVKITELFKNLINNIDDNTGLIKPDGMQYLNELFELKPEWKDELNDQFVIIDEKAEQDYKQLQQNEWLKFHEMKTKLDSQRLELLKSKDELSTTATTTTNVNGFFYNSLQTASTSSLVPTEYNNPTKLSQFSSNSLRNLMRPSITPNGSFNNNMDTNLWTTPADPIDHSQNSVNMLLPQNLINGDEGLFDSQSLNQFSPSITGMIPSSLSPSSGIPTMNSNMSNGLNAFTTSPNLQPIANFDLYPTTSGQQQSNYLNTTPQHSRITSLSGVLAANPNVGSSTNLIQPQMLSSPNTSDNMLLDPTQSPFNNFQHRSTRSNGSEFDPMSLLFAESNQHYGTVFAKDDNNDINRVRSSSFGSSIWSNGNNPNSQTTNWGASNGFSFLNQPLTMTSTTEEPTERTSHHERSPSFLKSMIGKIGSSPTKTISNKTMDNHISDDHTDISSDHASKSARSGSSGSGNPSTAKSSRFFKLGGGRKNSVVSNSQNSTNSAPFVDSDEQSSNSGFNISRKLSFAAFKSNK
ncbi:hypothetical protein CANINC_001191 [Pichia inconspicua]|uniref:Fibronectin type-III domain-containing protein n=1 Tax=Pichia inconspicua TaxID=52247 RepID=A0A4T0X5U2_9ASCO|nr:hypothetical protein CANINC_001191 [[Candida] inconspicua]